MRASTDAAIIGEERGIGTAATWLRDGNRGKRERGERSGVRVERGAAGRFYARLRVRGKAQLGAAGAGKARMFFVPPDKRSIREYIQSFWTPKMQYVVVTALCPHERRDRLRGVTTEGCEPIR